MTERATIFFPNLNGVRFIAAALVILFHVEQFKDLFGIHPNAWETNPFFIVIGKLGVILFFVLSGFLITYLLLVEKQRYKTISVRNFYIRRVIRIWPLYYLVVLLSFFILPSFPFFHIPGWSDSLSDFFYVKLILFVVLLPNVARAFFSPVPFGAQAWSVGVEEQFYLIWPLIIKYSKNIFRVLVGVIILYLIVKFTLLVVDKYFFGGGLDILLKFWVTFNVDCMAIGGIFALWLFEKKDSILKFLYKEYVQYLTYVVLVTFIALGVNVPLIHYEFYAVLFGIVILNLASNPNTIINMRNSYFEYLGKISYSLYMLHPIAILLTIKLCKFLDVENPILLSALSISLTVVISALSYEYFEKRFLRLKDRFTKVVSGIEAKPKHIHEAAGT